MDNRFENMDAGRSSDRNDRVIPLDSQYAELIEIVLACERSARQLDRIDSAIKYGRRKAES